MTITVGGMRKVTVEKTGKVIIAYCEPEEDADWDEYDEEDKPKRPPTLFRTFNLTY